jgi:hypothetical protein
LRPREGRALARWARRRRELRRAAWLGLLALLLQLAAPLLDPVHASILSRELAVALAGHDGAPHHPPGEREDGAKCPVHMALAAAAGSALPAPPALPIPAGHRPASPAIPPAPAARLDPERGHCPARGPPDDAAIRSRAS